MNSICITRATLGRLPMYLKYLKSLHCGNDKCISSTAIAKALNLGDVQVRKDLNSISGGGKPKTGYVVSELIKCLESVLTVNSKSEMIIVGAGKLGRALMDYEGFEEYGLTITAAFDNKTGISESGKQIYHINNFRKYCSENDIKIGIITVPAESAQDVCNMMIESNIRAIWNFAQCNLCVPSGVMLKQENIALSVAHLNNQLCYSLINK